MTTAAKSTKVWDIWIRVSHILIIFLFFASFFSAINHRIDIHVPTSSALVAVVVFRILWGFVGSENSRWRRFLFSKAAIGSQISKITKRSAVPAGEHTPLGSLMALALIILIFFQGVTALFLTDHDLIYIGKFSDIISASAIDLLAEIHEVVGITTMVLAIIHTLAALYYLIWKRANLIVPMITGKTRNPPNVLPKFGSWWLAVPCILLALSLIFWLFPIDFL